MTTLKAAIPDDLHDAVLAQAEREHISVDAFVSRTLRAAISSRGNSIRFAANGIAGTTVSSSSGSESSA